VEGGRTVTVEAPLDQIPLFVKGGAIVPMRPVASHTEAQPTDTLDLAVYPDSGRAGSFSLYEDDGRTLNYQDGAYAVTDLTQRLHAQNDGSSDLSISVGPAVGTYAGQPARRTVRVHVRRVPKVPERIRLNGETLPQRAQRGTGWQYDAEANVLTVRFRGPVHASHWITIDDLTPAGHY
jgi:alpha-glucosidase (family GH31 glycosyl hydrolase)